MTSQQALRQLLRDHPERIVTHREVCERLGHSVSRFCLSRSAAKIPRSECIAVYGCKGGYAAPAIARPPAPQPAPQPAPTAQSVLAELLEERPCQLITRADVCARLGHAVSRATVSKVAGRLGCNSTRGCHGGYSDSQYIHSCNAVTTVYDDEKQTGEGGDMKDDRPPMLSAGEFARQVGISTATAGRWAEKGRITGVRAPDGAWLIPPSEVLRMLAEREATDRRAIEATRIAATR